MHAGCIRRTYMRQRNLDDSQTLNKAFVVVPTLYHWPIRGVSLKQRPLHYFLTVLKWWKSRDVRRCFRTRKNIVQPVQFFSFLVYDTTPTNQRGIIKAAFLILFSYNGFPAVPIFLFAQVNASVYVVLNLHKSEVASKTSLQPQSWAASENMTSH